MTEPPHSANPIKARAIVDSNVLIALVSPTDSLHRAAHALVASALNSEIELLYLDCVVAESLSTVGRRLEEKKRMPEFGAAADALMALAPMHSLVWLFPEARRLHDPIIALMRQTTDQLNFNDALIVVACRELGITTLLSFDADFDSIAGLTRLK